MAADRVLSARNDIEPELSIVPSRLIEVFDDDDEVINSLNHKRVIPFAITSRRSAKFKLLLNIAKKAQVSDLRWLNLFLNFAGCLCLNDRGLHGRVRSAAVAAHGLDDQVVAFLCLLPIQFPESLCKARDLVRLLANEDQRFDNRATHFLDLVRTLLDASFAGS